MKKIYILFISMMAFMPSVFAQHNHKRCGATEKREQLFRENPTLRVKFEETKKSLRADNSNKRTESLLIIPVVVHIVYKNTTDNLSDSRIHSQIDVLNKDFRKLNADKDNVPSYFKPLAADCEIEFRLANRDPQGNVTTGITRTQTSRDQFTMDGSEVHSNSSGGKTAWPTDKYLNIWVCPLEDGLLGYASFPGDGSSTTDGVVITTQAFGVYTSSTSSYNKGRTGTHEVGHYLGLDHLWGVDGGCSDDDNITDTPNQFEETTGCPTGKILDQCTASGDGIMYMNYMDYVNDACMNMFTTGQKTEMRKSLQLHRSSLLNSPGFVTGFSNITFSSNFDIFPNPAKEKVSIKTENNPHLKTVNIVNTLGEVVRTEKNNNSEFEVNCSGLTQGVYILQVSDGVNNYSKKLIITE